MYKPNFDVDNLRVASPCSVGWETMSGDERVRRCHSCELNIYNISEMTKREVEDLITKRESRVCIRLYKRADGTVLTKDCPVGFRAYQKRVARFAGAALATILGLFSVSFGQKEDTKTVDASKVKISRTINQNQESILSGIVTDSNGVIIPKAELKLYKKGDIKPLKTKSNDEGNYFFKNLSTGNYTLEIKYQGFVRHKFVDLKIERNGEVKIDVELQPSQQNVVVGIFVSEPLIAMGSSGITTKITRKQIDNLPH